MGASFAAQPKGRGLWFGHFPQVLGFAGAPEERHVYSPPRAPQSPQPQRGGILLRAFIRLAQENTCLPGALRIFPEIRGIPHEMIFGSGARAGSLCNKSPSSVRNANRRTLVALLWSFFILLSLDYKHGAPPELPAIHHQGPAIRHQKPSIDHIFVSPEARFLYTHGA